MPLDALEALSPLDGRYARSTDLLRPHLSEAALIRERIRIEAQWLLHLVKHAPKELPATLRIPPEVLDVAHELANDTPAEAPTSVKAIELKTNHDVKAVEYWVRDQLDSAGASPAVLELVHFGCTSEDINNLAYARMLSSARETLLKVLRHLIDTLRELSGLHAPLAMLARTHGQAASPTTLGKEIANTVSRLTHTHDRWKKVTIRGKFNGAVGNYNAHLVAAPNTDWPQLAKSFVESMGLSFNTITTQIEPHDWIAEYCDAIAATNVVLIDFSRDIWGYISLGYLKQRAVSGEVGSSTMPHKINPIDFENGEGNLGIANALLHHFAEKLPLSRWQRDLTDSTVLRNLGVALGHTLIAWNSIERGLAKIEANPERIAEDLENAWEVLGEAVQTVLRANGVPNGYELLKEFTRGRQIDAKIYKKFVSTLPLGIEEKTRLAALKPSDYVGLAAHLTTQV